MRIVVFLSPEKIGNSFVVARHPSRARLGAPAAPEPAACPIDGCAQGSRILVPPRKPVYPRAALARPPWSGVFGSPAMKTVGPAIR
jgi:hypothetical protein